jgi:hypothetical protein
MKDPMSLDKLPGYLKELKESGSTDDSLIVDMGQIVVPKEPLSLAGLRKKIAYAITICLIIATSIITVNSMSNKNITVVIDAENANIQTVSKIITDGGGQVLDIKQNEDNTYEVKVLTKNTRSFLELLRKEIKVEIKK